MTHYDVTMYIPSNIITYCDVIMGHGTKMLCPQCNPRKSSAHNGISTGDLAMEIPFKQAIAWHNILEEGIVEINILVSRGIWLII